MKNLTKTIKENLLDFITLFILLTMLYFLYINNMLWYYNSDNLTAIDFYNNIIKNGFTLKDWHPTNVSYLFDKLLIALFYGTTNNLQVSYFLYSVFLIFSIFLGLNHFYKNIALSIRICVLFVALIILSQRNFHMAMLYPIIHSSTLFCGFYLLGFLFKKIENEDFNYSFYLAVFMSYLLGHSDELFYIWYFYPLLLFMLLKFYQSQRNKVYLPFLLGAISLVIYFLDDNLYAEYNGYIRPKIDLTKFFDISDFGRLTRLFIMLYDYTFLWFLSFIVITAWYIKIDFKKFNFLKSKDQKIFFLLLVGIITNFVAIYLFRYFGYMAVRYVWIFIFLPFVFAVKTFKLESYLLKARYLTLIVLIFVGLQHFDVIKGKFHFVPQDFYPPVVRELDEFSEMYGVKNGASHFWISRFVNVLSKNNLQITPYQQEVDESKNISLKEYRFVAYKKLFENEIEFYIVDDNHRPHCPDCMRKEDVLKLKGTPKKEVKLKYSTILLYK